jgi:cobalt-zinc-cadmium efflux system membrane fusion protein
VLSAPFAGTVVARDAVIGKSATPGQVLFELADLTTMWAQLDIPEADASLVRAGQSVVLTFEGNGVPSRAATITRVGASVDAATRTVKARIELANQDRSLKAGTFVRARIQIAQPKDSLMVPRGAIQRAEGHTLVFVKREPGVYEPVVVEIGASARETVEVRKGLAPGAEIVTTGAFLLKTELLKDSIGAGCCDEGEGK